MNVPVVGSPVMEELLRPGKERCFDRNVLLGYSSYYSDNDSNLSVKHMTGCAEQLKVRGQLLCFVVLIFDI